MAFLLGIGYSQTNFVQRLYIRRRFLARGVSYGFRSRVAAADLLNSMDNMVEFAKFSAQPDPPHQCWTVTVNDWHITAPHSTHTSRHYQQPSMTISEPFTRIVPPFPVITVAVAPKN